MLGIKNHRVAPSVDSHQDVDNESCTSPSTRSTRAPKVPAARRPCDVSLQDMSTGTARPVSEWAQLLSGSSAIYSSKIASMLQRKRGRLTFRSASLEAVYGRYYLGFWKRQVRQDMSSFVSYPAVFRYQPSLFSCGSPCSFSSFSHSYVRPRWWELCKRLQFWRRMWLLCSVWVFCSRQSW